MIVPHPSKPHAPIEARTIANIQISFGLHNARSQQCCSLAFLKNFHQWCLLLLVRGGKAGHKETRIQLKKFFFGDWEEF
jgi:hypothetical protein